MAKYQEMTRKAIEDNYAATDWKIREAINIIADRADIEIAELKEQLRVQEQFMSVMSDTIQSTIDRRIE